MTINKDEFSFNINCIRFSETNQCQKLDIIIIIIIVLNPMKILCLTFLVVIIITVIMII